MYKFVHVLTSFLLIVKQLYVIKKHLSTYFC
nr:MAG TPA: hypothetical protein [Bacteriophage sp.]DAM18565.1 MAG TPA: hypothetical protein [Bacteriophage sp.]DAN64207.1 MAG TPA: hypothetical protein [Bacteriophage sp.]DAU46250.1 MAG TPA: hypothetical protein [Bacteriophage sp.]